MTIHEGSEHENMPAEREPDLIITGEVLATLHPDARETFRRIDEFLADPSSGVRREWTGRPRRKVVEPE